MKNKIKKERWTQQDVEIASREKLVESFFHIERVQLRHRLFCGQWGPWLQREVVDRGHAVAVLPYDPVRDQLVLIEQFRVGAVQALMSKPQHKQHTENSPWLYEVVAGMIDTPESAVAVAKRELQEETGLQAQQLQFILDYQSSPGGLTERVYLYLALVEAPTQERYAGLDEEEDIRVFTVDWNDAVCMYEQGQLDNSATLIAMQWLMLNREKIRQRTTQYVKAYMK